jgi:archaellum component FlaC
VLVKGDHTRVTPGKDKDEHASQIDLDEVARLIEALERDLNRVQGTSKDLQRLRDEVDTLKNVLRSPVRRHHWVRDALHDIRERFDDALDATVAEGIEVSRYVAEIGRILGL